MLDVRRTGPARLDIALTGELDAEGMRAGLDSLVSASEGIRNGRMLYRIPDFRMPTLGAIAVELGRLPQLFGLIGRFERAAVLSDLDWVRRWAEIEGAVIPGLAIRAFPLDAEAEAEAWLAEGDAA